MSDLQETETLIAVHFGNLKNGRPFALENLEDYVTRVDERDKLITKMLERRQIEMLAKRYKPVYVCRNPNCNNDDEQLFELDEALK